MKKRIAQLLILITVLFGSGVGAAVYYMNRVTDEMRYLIQLHEVEQLRRAFINDLQKMQSKLYRYRSERNGDLVADMSKFTGRLRDRSDQCMSCHHSPVLTKDLDQLRDLVSQYNSEVLAATGPSAESMDVAGAEATGERLLSLVEGMSHTATAHLSNITEHTFSGVSNVKSILLVTVACTFLISLLLAIRTGRSITGAMNKLVNATNRIASGNYGTTIEYEAENEFGELARNFNRMSAAVRESYESVRREIQERRSAETALSESEKFLKTVFSSIRDPLCIFDRDYRIVKANAAYAEIRQQPLDSLYGTRCHNYDISNTGEKCDNCVVHATFLSRDPCAKEALVETEDGSRIWLDIYTYPIYDQNGEVSHVIEYIRDISERKKTEEALRESKNRYELAALGANDGLWDWDITSGRIYYSPRWKNMLGISSDAVASTVDEWFGRIHPDDRGRVQSEIGSHVEGITAHFSSEHRLLHNDGTYRWMQFRGLAVRDASGVAMRMAGSMTDITDRKEAEQRLVYEALHDSLTGLPNRALFMDRLKHAIDHGRRSTNYLFAVLFMDIDRFKILNDSLGHAAGDEMLMAVSGRLQECLRDCDTVSRFGGDEFAILLENLNNENEALYIVRRIKEKIGKPFSICGQDIYTSASIGIVFSTSDCDSADTLLRNADIAMYHAKSDGSVGYGVFNSEMYADAVNRLEMETDLRVAVKNREFRLLYQPVIAVNNGRLVGFESLLRWVHPVHGIIGPGNFMRVAEDTGVIVEIGEWVITEACRQLSEWQRLYPADPPMSISVNISSKQLFPGLVRHVRDGINENGIQPGSLILELTESMMMENRETVVSLLADLKKMNVGIHIDDFGTGYSSLSYLNDLPVDVLKVDRSFISQMGRNGDRMEIVRAITMLARSLEMGVIAEGVETEDQIFRLRGLGCDQMQGYYFSVPLEPEKAEALIDRSRSAYSKREHACLNLSDVLFLKSGKVSK